MNQTRKPVLVTGATGAIGSMLARRLSSEGYPLRVLVRDRNKAAGLLAQPATEVVLGDLARPESLRGCLEGCSLVYHCAAMINGADKAAFTAVNITGTQVLLEEANRVGLERFVHVSSVAAYGLGHTQNVTEETPLEPSDWLYSSTKRAADLAVQAAAVRQPVAIARPGDVFGPEQFAWNIQLIQRARQGVFAAPVPSSSGILNLTYIDNLIDALLLLGSHPAALGQAFNVVDGQPMRVSDYFSLQANLVGKKISLVPGFTLTPAAILLGWLERLQGKPPSMSPGAMDYLLSKMTFSNAKIRALLGWTPAVNFEEGWRRTTGWLRSAGYLS